MWALAALTGATAVSVTTAPWSRGPLCRSRCVAAGLGWAREPGLWLAPLLSFNLSAVSLLAEAMIAGGCSPSLAPIDMPLSLQPITSPRAADEIVSRASGAKKCATHNAERAAARTHRG